ncbi:efflux RND transporter periplasmic adaptor subunit [Chondromyces apiculatus]|uniref:Putative Co/Zn/Cd efflux system membrane fusion protein n=1 Tax=Chondromyces apiculatus DSM 436 TaxID=1192034 RepID=A0A017TEH2_9BACT|nr:efflux RND transporter periplasmic adaptor subunit [Chondromyces apiculatus]EYF07624.1 putative Co/Zn/Cd efflux system membrane fusion protein [Chondromyces apiculatus DSM 436]
MTQEDEPGALKRGASREEGGCEEGTVEERSREPAPEEHFHEGEEAPPRGVKGMAVVRWVLLAVMALAAVASVVSYVAPKLGWMETAQAAQFYCPMHPQITSDRPGECPICHMALEPIPEGRKQGRGATGASTTSTTSTHAHGAGQGETHGSGAHGSGAHGSDAHGSGAHAAAAATVTPPETGFWCPMHPEVRSETPGAICEKCGGMVLVPVPTREEREAAAREALRKPPQGTTEVTVALDRAQAIGVRTARVEKAGRGGTLRVTAAVEAPEQGRAEVNVRAEGFVEAIRVKQTGVRVKAGELLASVYSPEIFQAQQELLAMKAFGGLPSMSGAAGVAGVAGVPGMSGKPGTGDGHAAAVSPPLAAARKRLELLGLGAATVTRILEKGEPVRAVGVSSPISGYVVRKNVVLGSRVTPEAPLFEVVDLAQVYIIASVHPSQLAGVRVGDRATFTTPSLPGKRFEARVDLVYPDVDLATRSARVRFQVENAELALRPGQFGMAELHAGEGETLTVPRDAVVDTGRAVYVFVVKEGGRYVPRAVTLGPEVGERVVVTEGVTEGEEVVARATFLIDAESRLSASLSGEAPR